MKKNYSLWKSEEALVQEYHSTIAPSNAIIWYDEQGNIVAIEPYTKKRDSVTKEFSRHFYNRVGGEELDNWEILELF